MFTGLIQNIGTILSVRRVKTTAELSVRTSFENLTLGESVSVSGACLTVTRFTGDEMTAFASHETLEKTGLGGMSSGSKVNLERALRVGDPMGGHMVTGHVDARVRLISRKEVGDADRFTIALPSGSLAKQIAEKGSVALDGVSLTVNEVRHDSFDVMVIPLTLQETTLGITKAGDKINIETDVLAKYIARQLDANSAKPDIDIGLLEKAGFIR